MMDLKPLQTSRHSPDPAPWLFDEFARPRRVLVVEGQPEVRELISLTLETGPYTILLAEDGERALALARAHRPDIVVMDVVLPGRVDGFDLCRQLKHDARTRSAPVLILSAKSQAADRAMGFAAGADDYMTKPFSPLRLQHRVRELLNGRTPHHAPSPEPSMV